MNKYPTLKERYGNDKCVVSVWIRKELKQKIKSEAKRHGRLLSKYIEMVLQQAFEENEEQCDGEINEEEM